MTGGLMQLVASGAQDIFLTGSPMISYFKTVYRRHTNFAIETIKQRFDTPAGFGTKVSSTLSRNGDLVCGAYIQATLPDLTEKQAANFEITNTGINAPNRRYMRWVDNVGHYLLKSVEVSIGGVTIDRHYSDWFEIWCQLTVPAGQMEGYRKMIGQDPKNIFGQNTGLQADVLTSIGSTGDQITYKAKGASIVGRDIYIPLQFWFCRNVGLALPLISLQYHDVRIQVEFQSAEELILLWASDVSPTPTLGGVPNGWVSSNQYQTYVTHGSLSASLWVDYVFLDADERRRFAQVSHEYLIDQVQMIEDTCKSETNKSVKLNFSHPVKELLWILKGFESTREWSNFTNTQLPMVPPFQSAAVNNGTIETGLTGLPDETYISPSKLTLNIRSGRNLTGEVSRLTATASFTVVPLDDYVMKNGDVITVSSLNSPDSPSITIVVNTNHQGVALSFLTNDVVLQGVNYDNVASIVRFASTISTDKLAMFIRSPTNVNADVTIMGTQLIVDGGIFSVYNTDDYQMMVGDIIKIRQAANPLIITLDERILTVMSVTNGTATSVLTRTGLLAGVTYDTVLSIIRPASGALLASMLSINLVLTAAITAGTTISSTAAGVLTFTVTPDLTYQMEIGDIITVRTSDNTLTVSLVVKTATSTGTATSFTCGVNLPAKTYNKVISIVRPSNETNPLPNIVSLLTGLSNIKTFDDLMRFSNYNSMRPYSSFNGLAANPVVSAVLTINTHERFMERPGSYFSLVQTQGHHTNIPESPGINVYSFALKPEEHQPSGTCNFSRLDVAYLRLKIGQVYCDAAKLPPGSPMGLIVYALNYNILRIVNGMGGLAYSGGLT
jgi:hypothetical protein